MAKDETSTLPDDIRESIAIGTVDAIAGQTSALSNLSYANVSSNINLSQQNAVSTQQAISNVGLSVLGKAVNLIANLSPLEAVAVVKMDTGNDIAEQMSDLQAEMSAFPSPPPLPLTPANTTPVIKKTGEGTKIVLSKKDLPATIEAPSNVSVSQT